jgi:hypothetical protein
MKINYILNYLTKNKIIIAFLIILFTIFFHLSIFYITNSREGFSTDEPIGEYDYLAPFFDLKNFKSDDDIGNLWSDDTWKDFISKWNSIYCPNGTGDIYTCLKYPPGQVKNSTGVSFNQKALPMTLQASDAEAQYYAKNGKWPYNGYVINFIKEHPKIFETNNLQLRDFSGNVFTIDTIQKLKSNRVVYTQYILPLLNIKNDSTDPLSYQILMGKAKPPSSSLTSRAPSTSSSSQSTSFMSSFSSSTPFSTPSSSSNSNSSNSNYQDFVSLCKKVANTN